MKRINSLRSAMGLSLLVLSACKKDPPAPVPTRPAVPTPNTRDAGQIRTLDASVPKPVIVDASAPKPAVEDAGAAVQTDASQSDASTGDGTSSASSPSVLVREGTGTCVPTAFRNGEVVRASAENGHVRFSIRGGNSEGGEPKDFHMSMDIASGAYAAESAGGPEVKPSFGPPGYSVVAKHNDLRVCDASGANCKVVKIANWPTPTTESEAEPVPENLLKEPPASVSPDGTKVSVALHNGKRNAPVSVRIYDVASGKMLSENKVAADFIGTLHWFGNERMVFSSCVVEGPGCSAYLFDPAHPPPDDLEQRTLLGNIWGVTMPFLEYKESMLMISGGLEFSFFEMQTGALETSIHVEDPPDISNGTVVVKVDDHQVAVVGAGDFAGDVFVLNLDTRQLTRTHAPVCSAGDGGGAAP